MGDNGIKESLGANQGSEIAIFLSLYNMRLFLYLTVYVHKQIQIQMYI